MLTTHQFTIHDRNRPLTFHIHEMPALRLESWLIRAGRVLAPEAFSTDAADATGKPKGDALTAAKLLFEKSLLPLYLQSGAKGTNLSLMDELLACCFIVDEDGQEIPLSPDNVDHFIESLTTLQILRREALAHNLRFYTNPDRQEFTLPREAKFRRALDSQTFAHAANIPPIVGSVISQGMASLQGMQSSHSFTDALDMLELLNVRNYNQWAAQEAAKNGR